MRTLNWCDRHVYRITKIVFRQHTPWNSYDIMDAEGRDTRGLPIKIEIYSGPFKTGAGGLVSWLISRALEDGLEDYVLMDESRIFLHSDIPGSAPVVTELTA
jgi:hypothetical protein